MCNRSGQASLAAAPIEVLSGLKNTRIQIPKKVREPAYLPHYDIFGGTRGEFLKIVVGIQNFASDPILKKYRK